MQWQPIETAPKDGTFFDIWRGSGENARRETDVSFNSSGQLCNSFSIIKDAKFWMPLPPSPENE